MKKNKRNELVTKDHLDEKFKEFTREFWNRLEKYLDFRFEPYERMRIDFYSFKDKMERNIDWLMGKIQKFDQTFSIWDARFPDMNNKPDNHETRITKLEENKVS